MSDSGRGWKWQCRNCDRPKIVGDLCAACSESAYQAALAALEASHRERDKLRERLHQQALAQQEYAQNFDAAIRAKWSHFGEQLPTIDGPIEQAVGQWFHEHKCERDKLIADSCETDTAIREACRKVLGAEVDGDSVAVPPVEDLVERVAARVAELEAELAREQRK